jgi:hypothetical protein
MNEFSVLSASRNAFSDACQLKRLAITDAVLISREERLINGPWPENGNCRKTRIWWVRFAADSGVWLNDRHTRAGTFFAPAGRAFHSWCSRNKVVHQVAIISSEAIGLKIAMLGGTKIDSAEQKAT